MLGPLFYRELAISPKRTKIYTARTIYAVLFWIVISTAWLLISGSQQIRDVGDLARYGIRLFSLLAPLQMTLILFTSAIFCAGNVSQEKDRKTLDLLLLTNLSNPELVLGKLSASLLHVLLFPLAVLPVMAACTIFGGVDISQVLRVFVVTVFASLVGGSLGTAIAFRSEKTFMTLCMTILCLVAWLILGESAIFWGDSFTSTLTGIGFPQAGLDYFGLVSGLGLARAISPWQAVLSAASPLEAQNLLPFILFCMVISAAMVIPAVVRVRVWNPPRKVKIQSVAETSEDVPVDIHAENQISRPVWDNPILWREVRTAAYGRRLFLYRLGYLAVAGLCFYGLTSLIADHSASAISWTLLPLALLSLVLINAQSVTAITTERDGKALDLLLSSDLRPAEFVWGKLLGALWNTREMILAPMVLAIVAAAFEALSWEFALYIILGYTVLVLFSATLGLHTGMIYANSRQGIGTSLGTLFFLFVGVAVCLRMMLAFSGSFQAQFQPFLALIVGGSVALYAALGIRNPSSAIAIASFGCPCATFYALVALLMNYSLGVFLVVSAAYGFAMAAMLIPAIYEFDIVSSKAG